MNRPPEQRGHPQVQSDVAQARDVLHDHVQKLENQKEPLSEAQKKELTDAKATLSRLPGNKPASTPESTPRPE
jgi:chaperonin cofactor prefoldin